VLVRGGAGVGVGREVRVWGWGRGGWVRGRALESSGGELGEREERERDGRDVKGDKAILRDSTPLGYLFSLSSL